MNSFPLYVSRLKTGVLLILFTVFTNNLSAQFSEPNTVDLCWFCIARTMDLVDLDQDGDLDIVVHWEPEDADEIRIEWFENDGKGNFDDPEILFYTTGSPRRLLVTDLDMDGDLDILTAHQNNSGNLFHENLGGLEFAEPDTLLDTGHRVLLSADLDQDGDMDMIMGSGVYLNDGNLNFTHAFENVSLTSTFGNSVVIVDWDGDGDLDIFGHPGGNTSWVRWYENLDNQAFADNEKLINFYESNGYVWSLDIKDADNDGDLDIYAGMYSNSSYYFENLGNNLDFETTELHSFTANPGYLVDLDVDGDLDPLKTNSQKGIVWHEHYGNSDFSNRLEIQEEASLTQVGDIDQDGDPDIVYVSGSQIRFLRNLHDAVCVSGKVYVDENSNSTFETNEEVVDPLILNFEPQPVGTTINDDGSFKYYFDKGDYQVSIDPSDCWIETNGSNTFEFSIDTTDLVDMDFAVEYNSEHADMTTYLTSGPTRCGFTVPFTLNTFNTGCKVTSGDTYLVLDELATLVTAQPLPDNTNGDTLFWNNNSLPVDGNSVVAIEFEIAGVDNLGDTIQIPYGVKGYENNQEIFHAPAIFESIINCAYDPNDKITFPARGGRNYTLMEEELLYTIRFQNTGTDTAFNIEIRDELSSLLDYNTFRLVHHTHPVVPELNYYTNKLHFHFDNVLLPDSTTNLAGSQGQVSFAITPLGELAEKAEIFNEAEIYFDFNPPIITNEVVNTFVTEFNCIDSIGPNGEDILPLDLSVSINDILCFGEENGVINLNANGGIGPYHWDNSSFPSEITLENLAAGTYSFTVLDNGNCVDFISTEVVEPAALMIDPIATNVDCFGNSTGSILSNVTGGVPEYSFLWNGMMSTENLENIPAGVYDLTVLDLNNCEAETTFTITEPDGIAAFITNDDDASCNGSEDGSIVLLFDQDSLNYTFLWENGTTTHFNNDLGAGIYLLTITDENDCTFVYDFEITEPDIIVIEQQIVHETAGNMDGSITVTPSGGLPPFSYIWSHDETIDSNTAANLPAGTYTVNITDSSGCTNIITAVVESVTNTNQIASAFQFTIHPNPSSGAVFVELDSNENLSWQLKIHNVLGQVVREFDTPENQMEVNLEDGFYLFSVYIDGVLSKTRRVVVDK